MSDGNSPSTTPRTDFHRPDTRSLEITVIYENRFIADDATEVFTYALLRTVGIDCTLYGNQSKSGDMLLPNDKKLSIKSTFTSGVANIKLMNKLGGGHREWDTATLFVVSNVGIIFGAPDMIDNSEIRDVSDGTESTKKGLLSLIRNQKNVFNMEIDQKPPSEMTGFSHKGEHCGSTPNTFRNGIHYITKVI